MRYLSFLFALLLTGCTSTSLYSFNVWEEGGQPGLRYEVIELVRHNALAPSYSYQILKKCEFDKCEQVAQNPNIQPGLIYAVAPALVQAGGMIGAGALIGSGIRDSASSETTNVNNNQTSSANATSKSNSSSNSTSHATANATGKAPKAPKTGTGLDD